MKKEFVLSDKMIIRPNYLNDFIHIKHVKEFIRLLKEKAKEHDDFDGYNPDCNQSFTTIIDPLAGKELI